MIEEDKKDKEYKEKKTLEERVDFLENKVRILENKISSLSSRINSSERSNNNHVDVW